MGRKKGEVVFACLVPHPPIMVPEVGGIEAGKVEQTARAIQELGRRLAAAAADTVIVITPHGPMLRDTIVLGGAAGWRGDLGAFGAPDVALSYPNDLELVAAIKAQSATAGFSVLVTDQWSGWARLPSAELDHGVVAPFYYLSQATGEKRLVVSSYALLSLETLYHFGVFLGQVIRESGKRVAVVASGDLSHRLLPSAPAGYDPQGRVFDQRLQELLASLDVAGIINLPPELIERAGECGLRSLAVALGALDGLKVAVDILSYEGPFGVGYLVAALEPRGEDPGRCLQELLRRPRGEQLAGGRPGESLPVRLARETLEAYVRGHRGFTLPVDLPPELQKAAGAFVSLKKQGKLRGCIGTVKATKPNLAEEIAANAINAGTADPRFEPVQPEELADLTYSVDVLGEPEPVRGLDQLDPKRYGVIVRKGWRTGLLLPDLEGVDTAADQVRIAKLKAGIAPDEDCELERFEVIRYY